MAIGNILRAASAAGPGLLRGLRERDETEYQRSQEDAERQRRQQAEQRAYDQWLMQFNEQQAGRQWQRDQAKIKADADAATRQRAYDQAGLITQDEAQRQFLADNPQTLAGIVAGQHKPQTPQKPDYQRMQDTSGNYIFFDPNTGQRVDSGVRGRVPGTGGGDGGPPSLKFGEVARLRGEFDKKSNAFNIASTAAKQAESFANLGTGQGDIGLIYSYVKTLDPESVVREGEFAVATRAASTPDQIGNAVRRVLSGQQLSPQQRQNLVQATRTLLVPARERYQRDRQFYSSMAQRYQVDPYEIIGDDPFAAEQQGATSGSSMPAAEDVLRMGTGGNRPSVRDFIQRNRPR